MRARFPRWLGESSPRRLMSFSRPLLLNLAFTLASASVFPLVSCASWDETRAEIVDPLNQLVHQDYPRALGAQDSERVAELFADDWADWARADAIQLIEPFSRIDRARCVIHDAESPDSQGAVETLCYLRLDGVRDGERFTWEQERTITAAPFPEGWRITSVELGPVVEAETDTVFREDAQGRGLIAASHSRGMPDRSGTLQPYLGSSGVAVGDVDGDDRDDLLLISGDSLRLFRNTGWTFEDVTSESGIFTPESGECRCAYFADVDNDGDQDLYVGILDGHDLLFENEGGGHFRSIPEAESGLRSLGHTAGACFADFDRDGILDLVVVNGNNMYEHEPDPPYNARNGNPDLYFRGLGDLRFEERTEEAGLGETGWGLACAVSDYDRDGDVDLFVANDVGKDLLYENNGRGVFEEVSDDVGIEFHGSSMSADFGDVNGDGWPDLYTSGMASNSRWLIKQPGFPIPAPFPIDFFFANYIRSIMWEMFHGNRLYLNQGDGTFEEVSSETNSYWLGWAWSAVFLDYDNDGHLDIYGVNGFHTGEDPEDC